MGHLETRLHPSVAGALPHRNDEQPAPCGRDARRTRGYLTDLAYLGLREREDIPGGWEDEIEKKMAAITYLHKP